MKKKIRIEVIAIIIWAAILVIAGIVAAAYFLNRDTGTNTTSNTTSNVVYIAAIDTQLYDEPSSTSNVIAQIPKSSGVEFIEVATNGFFKVRYNSLEGYVNGDYIIDQLTYDSQKENMYIVNTADSATMYANATTSSSTVTTVPLGTTVSVYTNCDENGFKKIDYNGSNGFVEAIYLSTDYSLVEKQQEINAAKAKEEAERQRIASLPQGSSDTVVKYSMWVYNVQNSIYLRTHPSESADIITTIPVGTQVGYITNYGGTWYKISYNGTMGYSKAVYLTTSNPNRVYYNPPSSSYRIVANVNVSAYLRRNPTSDVSSSNVICEVPLGTRVEYLGTYGSYQKVRYNGMTGYIASQYLR